MQRVRVGLTGLSIVFLIVLLAAAFLGLAGDRDDTGVLPDNQTIAASNLIDDTPKDPLAELGVAPGGSPSNEPAPGNSARR